MAQNAKLQTDITANADQFVREIMKSKKQVADLANTIRTKYGASAKEAAALASQAFGRMQREITSTNRLLKQSRSLFSLLAKDLLVIAGPAALVSVFKNSADAIDEMIASASKLSITTDQFQFLEYAAKRSDVALSSVESAMGRLKVKLASGKADSLLGAIGLDPKELQSQSSMQAFTSVATAIGNIKSATDRAYAANQLFGRGGVEIMNLLTANLQNLKREYNSLNINISDKDLKKFEELDKSFDQLSFTLSKKWKKALLDIAPAVTLLTNAITGVINLFSQLASKILNVPISVAKAANDLKTKYQAKADLSSFNESIALASRITKSGDAITPGNGSVKDMIVPDVFGLKRTLKTRNDIAQGNGPSVTAGVMLDAGKEATKSLKDLAQSAKESGGELKALLGLDTSGLGKSYLSQILTQKPQAMDEDFNRLINNLRDDIAGGGTSFNGSLDQRLKIAEDWARRMGGLSIDERGNFTETSNTAAMAAVEELKKAAANDGLLGKSEVVINIKADKNGMIKALAESPDGKKIMVGWVKETTAQEASSTGF